MNKIRNNIGTGLRIGYTFTQTAHVINIYMNKETDRRQTGRQRDKEKRRCSSVAHRSLRFYWERDTASPKWRHTKKYNKQQRPKKKKKKAALLWQMYEYLSRNMVSLHLIVARLGISLVPAQCRVQVVLRCHCMTNGEWFSFDLGQIMFKDLA